jgi:hypothetical protein
MQTHELNAAFPYAPGEFTDLVFAEKADETGDRLAGFDVEPVFGILGPIVGLAAKLEGEADVGMSDGGANAVRVVSKAQILMGIRSAVDVPFPLRLPHLLLFSDRLPRGFVEKLHNHDSRRRNVRYENGVGAVALRDQTEFFATRGHAAKPDRRPSLEGVALIIHAKPDLLPHCLPHHRLGKKRRRIESLDGHRGGCRAARKQQYDRPSAKKPASQRTPVPHRKMAIQATRGGVCWPQENCLNNGIHNVSACLNILKTQRHACLHASTF